MASGWHRIRMPKPQAPSPNIDMAMDKGSEDNVRPCYWIPKDGECFGNHNIHRVFFLPPAPGLATGAAWPFSRM